MKSISINAFAFALAVLAMVPTSSRADTPGRNSDVGAVYGRCAVQAQDWRDNFGECRLTGTTDGVVPANRQLIIEHISAVCTGPVEHQITILALATSLKQEEDTSTQIVVPLSRRESVIDHVIRYEASFQAKLYAGPGTKIEPYLALESGFVPSSNASCGVMFHGRFERVRRVE